MRAGRGVASAGGARALAALPWAAAAIAWAAACTVQTTGAPCDADDNCPTGQRCAGAVAGQAGSGDCQPCTIACTGGLVCGSAGGVEACICPPPAPGELAADAARGSAAGAAPAPSGAVEPPGCRFRSLQDALAAAAAVGAPATVRATGWVSGGPMVFSVATGETFPIRVAPDVRLASDDGGGSPTRYAIEFPAVPSTGPLGTSPALLLGAGSAVEGFVVRPAAGGRASDAVLLDCPAGGTTPSRVAGVLLEGKAGGTGPSLVDDGVHLTGACSAEVSAAAVRGMAQAGVRIESTGSAVATVDGSTIRECGDTGVVVRVGGSPTVRLTGNTITANSGTTTSGLDPDLRTVGGVLLSGVKPASLTFTGNRVYANRGDQVMVASSTPGWSLAGGTACAGSPAAPPNNLIACYDAATNGVGPGVGLSLVATSTGNVDARFNAWSGSPPQAGADFRVVAGGTIDAGAAATAFCQLPPGLCP